MTTVMDLVLVFLGSGAGVAITSLILEHWRHKRSRTESARHLAIRIAFELEGYAIDCAEKANDHQLACSSAGHAGTYLGTVPAPPSLPESTAYSLIDADVLEAILDFPQRCKMASSEAAFWWDAVGDMDCVRTAASGNTIKMGALAIRIAQRLRQRHRLPTRDLTFGEWDIATFFDEEARRIAELDAKRAQLEHKDSGGDIST